MSAFGQGFNSPIPRGQQQPQLLPSDPRLTPSHWAPPRPLGGLDFRPPGAQVPLRTANLQSTGRAHVLPPPPPHGLFLGNPQSRFPPMGAMPFPQPPFSPRQFPPGIPIPLRPPNIGPAGLYFRPQPHPTPEPPPMLAPSLMGPGGLFGPRGSNFPQPPPPLPDPTDVFLQEWLAGVTVRYKESQATVQEDRPMKASIHYVSLYDVPFPFDKCTGTWQCAIAMYACLED